MTDDDDPQVALCPTCGGHVAYQHRNVCWCWDHGYRVQHNLDCGPVGYCNGRDHA